MTTSRSVTPLRTTPPYVFEAVSIPGGGPRAGTGGKSSTPPPPFEFHVTDIPQVVCANCGKRFDYRSVCKAYCSDLCKQRASTVRGIRRAFQEHQVTRIEDLPDPACTDFRIKFAHAVSGTYDTRARTLPAKTRAAVTARDGGRCVVCGGPGEEIDHINGSSPDLSHLRLVCSTHHDEITSRRLVQLDPARDADLIAVRDHLLVRIFSPEPLRPCDAADWDPRVWVAHAGQAVRGVPPL